MNSRSLVLALGLFLATWPWCSVGETTKPIPTGNATPEGAAADLIRSYIRQDFELFNRTRHIRMCEGRDNPAKYYRAFLKHASFSDGNVTFTANTLPRRLTRISTVVGARRVHPSYRADLAYLAYTGLEDRVVVEVVVVDSNDTTLTHRTLVEKYRGGVWYAVPALSEWHSKHADSAVADSAQSEEQTDS